MGQYYTIRKKEDKEDERTVSASDYMERLAKIRREKEQMRDIPYTEMPKDNF